MTESRPEPAQISPLSSLKLTFVSWNICEAKASAAAPDPTQRTQHASLLIREEFLSSCSAEHRISSKLPDIIALQECPSPSWGQEAFVPFGYTSMGTKMSHCGWVDLLVCQDLAHNSRPINLGSWLDLPSVACVVTLLNQTDIAVSSSDLAPFGDGASERAEEFSELAKVVTKECSNCVMLGDYNMRQSEDRTFENMCGGG